MMLKGPFEIEGYYSAGYPGDHELGSYVVVYYHEDSGFGGTCNESIRMWWFI